MSISRELFSLSAESFHQVQNFNVPFSHSGSSIKIHSWCQLGTLSNPVLRLFHFPCRSFLSRPEFSYLFRNIQHGAPCTPCHHIRRLQQRRCSECNQSLFRCDTFLTLLFPLFVSYPLFFLHIPVVVVTLRCVLSLFPLLLLTSAFNPAILTLGDRYSILIFQIYLFRNQFTNDTLFFYKTEGSIEKFNLCHRNDC